MKIFTPEISALRKAFHHQKWNLTRYLSELTEKRQLATDTRGHTRTFVRATCPNKKGDPSGNRSRSASSPALEYTFANWILARRDGCFWPGKSPGGNLWSSAVSVWVCVGPWLICRYPSNHQGVIKLNGAMAKEYPILPVFQSGYCAILGNSFFRDP